MNRCFRAFAKSAAVGVFGLYLCISSAKAQFGLSPKRDLEQGEEVAKLVEQEIGLYFNPEAEEYVRNVGQRLVSAVNDPRWRFNFHIADQEEPNAFAIPGGGIYVSRGLLALVNREAELAGVLAHEIAHVTERHSARQQRKGILPGILSLPGNIVGGIVSEDLGALINAPIDTVGGAWLSRYSRGQESEADRIGIRTSARAGYDPTALADILERLEKVQSSQTGKEHQFSIFDSHPLTDTRLKDIRNRSADPALTGRGSEAEDTETLLKKLDGIWWGENPAQGIFRSNQFLHPVIGFTITLPLGWKHRNTPQFLISAHPQKEAMLLVGAGGPEEDPEVSGERFIAKMRKNARLEPASKRKAMLGALPAFTATYIDRSGRAPVYLHFIWVSMAGRTYELVALGPERHRDALREAALSFRPLTDTERTSIIGKRLRIVKAREGERIEDLGARSGNVWPTAFTALVNGCNPDLPLREGQSVKIARAEAWTKE